MGVNDSICGNCGYNFDTGENPDEGSDAAGKPTQPLTVYSEGSGPPRISGQGLGKVIAVAVLVLIVAVGAGIAFVANRVFDATEEIQDQVPDFGDFEFTPGEIGSGTDPATDYASCVKLLNKYLRQVLANDGQPADLTTIVQNAATEMGVGYEFNAFTTIYADTVGTAITDGTKPARKEAKADARDACRQRYGG